MESLEKSNAEMSQQMSKLMSAFDKGLVQRLRKQLPVEPVVLPQARMNQ